VQLTWGGGFADPLLIMDDEKYFQLADQSVPANRGFYSFNKRTTSPHVNFKMTRKFEPKILVWTGISASGISSPFFAKQKQAINQDTYLEECTVKRLMPFIESYHDKEKVLFWPDLVASQYSKILTQYLDQNGVQFVAKEFNPQNCPHARPIETLWSILKNMVYDQGWQARNTDQLERRIAQKMEELDMNVVQPLFSGIRKQLKKFAEHGPYEAFSSQFSIEETAVSYEV
jgi:transposase